MRVGLLSGIRVVELGTAWAGPYAARLLADLGAEVIKVEGPRRPDFVRFGMYVDDDPGETPWERGGHYQKFSRNKLSCVLDITAPAGHALFIRLLERSDVLIENNTPRVREHLGLTPAFLRERLPHLVAVSLPGFGDWGPYRNYLAFGLTIEGFSGLSSVTGYAEDGVPVRSTVPYGDPVAAVYGALAALAGIRQRRRTGRGLHVELSQHEALITLLPDVLLRAQVAGSPPGPAGNDDALLYAPHGVFPCRGRDAWVAIAVETDGEWRALCRVIGRPDLQERDTHEARDAAEVRRAVEAWTRGRTKTEAAEELQRHGVPAGPVLSVREMMAHRQVTARGCYREVAHPSYRPLPYAQSPVRFAGREAREDRHAPLFGQDNRYVFRDLLGLSEEEIQRLYAEGVTADRPEMA
ncbi:MAG TPA: CoA transferase [Dehalococcoidia bacterium]